MWVSAFVECPICNDAAWTVYPATCLTLECDVCGYDVPAPHLDEEPSDA